MTARYLTPLRLECVAPGSKNKIVLSPFIYDSDVLGRRVIVPAGFVTDLSSVPRLPLVYLLFGDVSQEAAAIHDWLYSGNVVTRAQADEVFAEAMRSEGVPAWQRGPMWLGVRLLGWRYYGQDKRHAQKTLPANEQTPA